MGATVARDFIRRAVELADVNGVRVALYHQTRDPEIAVMPVAAKMTPDDRERLIAKAVDWLETHAGPGMPEEPPEDELRALLNMATGEEIGELEFLVRREFPAFQPFPNMVGWTNGKPELPDGFKVAVIGSGFSGIAAGVQLGLLGIPYVVIERRADPGGTWTIHRYPDVRVDTASITYEFAFEKLYQWEEYFGPGASVRQYLHHVSKKYGVFENTRFNSDLKRATFDEAKNVWTLEIETPDGVETMTANVIISASGLFANPRVPHFEGQESFAGKMLHPSRWPADTDLTGKRVAIIGNGSTGVQMLKPIARDAEQVFVFQRTPQWISPREKYGAKLEPEVRWLVDNFPGYWHWWRYSALSTLFQTHGFVLADKEWQAKGGLVNPMSDKLRETLTGYIKAETGGRQDLIDKLTPDYAPFSRRPVVDNGWYRSLCRDNVELVTDDIARFTPDGIETADGTLREVDVIVTATGFDIVKFLWPAHYVGKDGRDLHETWADGDGPRAYLSMMVPEFPNLFMSYGPNSQPVSGGTSITTLYVTWAAYAAQCIVRMIEQGKSRVEVKPEAFARFNAELDEEAKKLVLMTKEGAMDKNYYVNPEHGRLQVNSPWYGPYFQRMCTEVKWDDLEIS
jgi:4-hydroxyacetophenone monooxygenase